MKGCTCRHTRVSIRVAERPSLSAGALVSCVARLTELGAALPRLHGAQRFVCMSETEEEAWGSHTDITWKKKKKRKSGQTTVASASHLIRSGCPRSPTCRRSRSLPRCRNTCRRSCRACLHTGLHLNGKEARRWKGVSTRTLRVYFKQALTNIDGPEEILQDKTCKVIPLCEDAVVMQTVRPRSSWPFGTSPGRNAWPARTCTRSPCRPAPWWSRRRCASGGAWASSPAVCPRTLHVMRVSDVSSTIRWNTDNQTGFKRFTEIRKFKKFEPEGLIISCCW